jgi:methyl-accepting chemotaxis protein
MKIGRRLGLGFGVMQMFMLVLAVLAMVRLAHIQQNLDFLVNDSYAKVEAANRMLDHSRNIALAVRDLMIMDDERDMAPVAALIAAEKKAYQEDAERMADLISSDEGRALMAKVAAARGVAEPLLDRAAALGVANKTEEASKVLLEQSRPAQLKWLGALDAMALHQAGRAATAQQEARAAYEDARLWTVLLTGAAMLAGFIVGHYVTRSITQPLDTAIGLAQQVAAGDLSARVVVDRRDEAGQLLQALADMSVSLAGMVRDVQGGSETIATAAREIAAGNLDLSTRTEQQAAALEETASSMEELTSTVRQSADNAQQANGLAESASAVARKGGAVVAEVVDTMAAINTSSKKIADIISVIDGIAFQTNILALNAAVEAARAGEQGRGFAVVATEVRTLAQRSAAAAKEIKGLIDDSVGKVDAGSALVAQAGATMDDIVGSVQRVTNIMGEISAATREQTAGIEQVNRAIAQMDQGTQQNAALVEESAAAAQSMREQADALAQTVGMFTLDGAPQAALHAVPHAAPQSAAARRAAPRAHAPARLALAA